MLRFGLKYQRSLSVRAFDSKPENGWNDVITQEIGDLARIAILAYSMSNTSNGPAVTRRDAQQYDKP